MPDAPQRRLDPFRTGLLIALLIISTATLLVALGKLTQPQSLTEAEIESLVDERIEERLQERHPPRRHHRLSPPANQEEVFVIVEQMPELIGGLSAIQQTLRYPEAAEEAGVEGRVIVQFTVDEEGRVTDARVVRGIGMGCDEAAVEAVKLARFKPGMQRGRPVKVRMSLPVTFRID